MWSPALLVKNTEATDDLIQGDGSGCGIRSSHNLYTLSQVRIARTRYHGHTQAVLPSESVHDQTVDQHTIAMITNNDNLVFDVTGDAGHRIPNRGDLLINC